MATRGQIVTTGSRRAASGREGTVVAARPRRGRAEARSVRVPFILILKIGLLLLCAAAALWGYNVLSSSFFLLRNVEVSGNHRLSKEELTRIIKHSSKPGLLSLDLDRLARELESIPAIKQANITRVLPDTLRVEVIEREPVALVRQQDGSIMWMSEDGITLGELESIRSSRIPPILTGLTEGDKSDVAQEDNRERIMLYQRIIRELDEGEPQLSKLIDEVDLRYPRRVRFQLLDSRIQIDIGDRDFRQRFQSVLEMINAARRGEAAALSKYHIPNVSQLISNADRISHISFMRQDRVSIAFAAPPKQVAAPSTKKATGGNK